jgi:hypothetical protein
MDAHKMTERYEHGEITTNNFTRNSSLERRSSRGQRIGELEFMTLE